MCTCVPRHPVRKQVVHMQWSFRYFVKTFWVSTLRYTLSATGSTPFSSASFKYLFGGHIVISRLGSGLALYYFS